MKNGIISAKKTTWRARLDLEYLDETSGRKASARRYWKGELESSDAGQKLKQFANYASKETIGQVHAGGFLHHRIIENPDGSRTAPSQLTNDERKKRISAEWHAHLRQIPTSSENPVLQHRLVFSMSTELHDKLVDAGISPDRVLQITTKKIMGKFADHFHPGDSIGYAYGLHHDTDNLHVHVSLCPRTAKGAYVGCSTSRSSTGGHKKQLDYVRKCFEAENLRWGQILSSPEQLQERISQREDSEKLIFHPKLSQDHLNLLAHSQMAEAQRLRQEYVRIRKLEQEISERRRQIAAKRNTRLLVYATGIRRSRPERLIDKTARHIARRTLRDMQDDLFQAKRNYRAAHKRYTQLHLTPSTYNPNYQKYAAKQTVRL